MKNSSKIAKYLLYFQILFFVFSGLLTDAGAPHAILYVLDVSNLALLACLCLPCEKRKRAEGRCVVAAMVLWLSYMLLSVLFKGPKPLLIAWALRNWARGFVVFCAVRAFLDKNDVKRFFALFKGIYILNFVLVLIGYFVYHKSCDYLGGVFGSQLGCNGSTNIFLCFLLILCLCESFEREKLNPFTVFVLVSAMVIAGLEELKFFYYEYAAIVLGVTVLYALRGKLCRKTVIATLTLAALSEGIGLLALWFSQPSWSFEWVTGAGSFSEYEETCRDAYKFSRVKFIPEMNEVFFSADTAQRLTGYGLGNGEYSGFDFLTSDFSKLYEDYNYHFFSTQTLYLEGGLVGLLLFMLIPLASAAEHGVRLLQRKRTEMKNVVGFLFAMIALLIVVYNNNHRTDASCLIYFLLACPYVMGE